MALDRVHTYCVKRFRHLLAERGQPIDAKIPFDAIFGAYGRILRDEGLVSEFALPALRVQHRLFEGLNQARNKRSLAHDEPHWGGPLAETSARYVDRGWFLGAIGGIAV